MKLIQFLKVNALAIAAVIVAGTTMSFKMAEKRNAPQTFYYNSTDTNPGDFHMVSNWSTTDNPEDPCFTKGERPCKVIVPDGSTLSTVLGSKTNAQVLAIAIDRKATP